MVAADEGSFDPGEEEDDDLPTTVLTDELWPQYWNKSPNFLEM
jgi:hypothetical protein